MSFGPPMTSLVKLINPVLEPKRIRPLFEIEFRSWLISFSLIAYNIAECFPEFWSLSYNAVQLLESEKCLRWEMVAFGGTFTGFIIRFN